MVFVRLLSSSVNNLSSESTTPPFNDEIIMGSLKGPAGLQDFRILKKRAHYDCRTLLFVLIKQKRFWHYGHIILTRPPMKVTHTQT